MTETTTEYFERRERERTAAVDRAAAFETRVREIYDAMREDERAGRDARRTHARRFAVAHDTAMMERAEREA